MIEIGDRGVKDIRIGESVVYRDLGGWEHLPLPEDTTGMVFVRINDDGTASLTGLLHYFETGKERVLLYPPEGYKFTSLDWTAGMEGQAVNGIAATDNVSGSYGNADILINKISDGDIHVLHGNYHNEVGIPRTVYFSKNSTIQGSDDGGPAIVGIEKV